MVHCLYELTCGGIYTVFQKSDTKIQITITMAHLIRINYPLSSFNYRLSSQTLQSSTKKSTTWLLSNSFLKKETQKQNFPIWKIPISILAAGSVTNNDIMLVTFLWRVWLTQKAMVFTKEDGILIKVLRQSKGYSARVVGGISWQGLVLFSTGPTSVADWRYRVCRQEVRQQQRRYGLHKRHANVCANGDHFQHKL